MSPTLNRSTALQRFEHGNAVEICNRIMFDFYPGLPHMQCAHYPEHLEHTTNWSPDINQ